MFGLVQWAKHERVSSGHLILLPMIFFHLCAEPVGRVLPIPLAFLVNNKGEDVVFSFAAVLDLVCHFSDQENP